MKPHKWAKEIIAWANGAEIEQRCHSPSIKEIIWSDWEQFDGEWTEEKHWEYRIKPQPKEPQYLYVWENKSTGEHKISDTEPHPLKEYASVSWKCKGKIELEQDE